jgi:hypothetical protein
MSQARFQKQQREKARREKAAAKWARKTERRERASEDGESAAPVDEAVVLAELAALHDRFDAGAVDFEEFSEAKDALIARLDVR